MRDVTDLHTHTIVSGHAYNTMNEMIEAAAGKKIEILGITEHGPSMPGSCTSMYFMNFRVLPRRKRGIRIFYGVELNIIDFEGNVDLPKDTLAEMDIVVASMHPPCLPYGNCSDITGAYVKAMKNPYINMIGHPDDKRYPIDYEILVKAAKEYHVILEMNNTSLSPGSFRGDPAEIYKKMLDLCVKHGVAVAVNSDAHVDNEVGNHSYAMSIVEAIQFPEELLVNANPALLKDYINYYK